MRAVVIDNRDSFVFNLVDDLQRAGCSCRVIRGDATLSGFETQLRREPADLIVLSPGPGEPEDAGFMVSFLRRRPPVPILGVCLGMQAMVVAAGGRVGLAPRLVHGRATEVVHRGHALFAGLGRSFRAGRYHSLAAITVPPEFETLATASEPLDRDCPMAIRHRKLPWVGFQFHPESVLTPAGPQLIANFIRSIS